MALTRITKGVIKPNENYDTHNINSTGIVTATGLDVSGNASIGGVLTYEDVTSIDSVGIITARDGIHVGAGVSAVGVGTFSGLKVGTGVTIESNGQAVFSGITTHNGSVDIMANDAQLLLEYPGRTLGHLTANYYNRIMLSSNSTDTDIVFGYTQYGGDSSSFANPPIPVVTVDNGDKSLKVGTGVTIETNGQATFTGIVTASTYYGDGSNLSNITSTTINNNAANKVIMGSNTANTLEAVAKSSLFGNLSHGQNFLNDQNLIFGDASDMILIHNQSTNRSRIRNTNDSGSLDIESSLTRFLNKDGSTEKLRITSGGRVLIGESSVAGSAKLVIGNGGAENFEFTSGNSTFNGGLIEYIHRGDGNTRPDMNMYIAGAGAFKVYTNGSNERLRIDSDGNITFGVQDASTAVTSAAIKHFDLGRDYWNGTKGDYRALRLRIYDNGNIDDMYGLGVSNGQLEIQSQGTIGFYASGAGSGTGRRVERLRITSAGLVDIFGSASQSTYTPLLLQNSAAAGNGSNPDVVKLAFGSQGSVKASIRAAVYGEGHMAFHTNNDTEKVRITAGGMISIGKTSNAGKAIEIYQASFAALRIQNSSTGTGNNDGILLEASGSDCLLYNYESANLKLGTSGQARLTIDSSGRVMIGTTTEGEASADNLTIADSGNSGISIRSGTSSWGSIFFSDATSGTGELSGAIEYKHNDNYMRFRTNGDERLRIESGGDVDIKNGVLKLASGANRRLFYRSGNNDVILEADSGDFYRQDIANSTHEFFTGNNERLRITAGGVVEVKTVGGAATFRIRSGGDQEIYAANNTDKVTLFCDHNNQLTIAEKLRFTNTSGGILRSDGKHALKPTGGCIQTKVTYRNSKFTNSSNSYQVVHSHDFTVESGNLIAMHFDADMNADTSPTSWQMMGLRIGSTFYSEKIIEHSSGQNMNASASGLTGAMSAGNHAVQLVTRNGGGQCSYNEGNTGTGIVLHTYEYVA